MPLVSPHGRVCLALVCVLLLLAVGSCGQAETATSQPSPQSSPLEFIGEWGTRGEGPGELADPVGLAVDLSGRVYLAGRGMWLVQKFEPSGVPLFSFEDRYVRSPSSIAVDSGGGIYVADAAAGRMRIYFPDGDLLRTFRVTPQQGDAGFFGFSVASDGTVFVPDPAGGRIQAFNSRGQLARAWKLPPAATGEPALPVTVAAALDEFVYVGDARTGRIVKYTRRGAQVALWEAPSDALVPLRGLAVSRSHLFVLRGARPQMEMWTLSGERLLTNSLQGRLEMVPPGVLSMAVTRDEELFLLDRATPRVLRFRLRLPAP